MSAFLGSIKKIFFKGVRFGVESERLLEPSLLRRQCKMMVDCEEHRNGVLGVKNEEW